MGGNVAVMDIQPQPAGVFEELAAKYSCKAIYIQTDVTKEDELKKSFARVVEEFGSINGLVPSAGIAIDKPFVDQTWDEFNRIQEINVGVGRSSDVLS
jgi:sorbose reductase